MPKSSKIVFFGSGPVATKTLEDLTSAGFEFEAIITKPRAPHHHGNVPVLEFAKTHNIPVFTPQNKAELSNIFAQKTFTSPLGLVVDYGIIIAKEVIQAFPKGIVNSHFSLLPEWRGADPITFSILSGQKETGVSLMLINEKLDEGVLLAEEILPLSPSITTPELTDKLVALSSHMLTKTLPEYLADTIKPYAQSDKPATYSRKLTKEDGVLDPQKPAEQLEREVRAFRGWPKSKITLKNGHLIIVTKARVATSSTDGDLVVECGDNTFLEILQLTAPSGRSMSGADFMRGYKKTAQ